RNTTDQQAQANYQAYQQTLVAHRERKRHQKEAEEMTTNLTNQILLKGIQPAEQFTGRDDQDPIAWVQGINELFVATGVKKEDRRKLLPMYFSDDVKKWYRNSEHEEDYDAFILELIRSFTSSTQRLNISSKLINRRQGVNESVQSYYYDILQL
ncbi:unnamed protein product, partial [Didymodactylos carnosus]